MTTKRRGMTEEAADAAIDQACRMLRMPTIRNSFTDYADRAGRERMSYRGFLQQPSPLPREFTKTSEAFSSDCYEAHSLTPTERTGN